MRTVVHYGYNGKLLLTILLALATTYQQDSEQE